MLSTYFLKGVLTKFTINLYQSYVDPLTDYLIYSAILHETYIESISKQQESSMK